MRFLHEFWSQSRGKRKPHGRVRIPWTFPLDLPLGLAGELSEKPGEIWESTCDRLVLHLRRLAMLLSASHHGNGDPPQQIKVSLTSVFINLFSLGLE